MKLIRDFLTSRKQSYLHAFKGVHGDKVLNDLSKFCRANQTTFSEDARVSALLEGRREVFLRITQHLNLSPEELQNIYNKGN